MDGGCVSSYRELLFLTCLSFFLVETLPQLADALVHQRHLHVALVQELLLLLQLHVLVLVQLVADLRAIKRERKDGRKAGMKEKQGGVEEAGKVRRKM